MGIDLSAFSALSNNADDIYASLTPQEEDTLQKKLLKHTFGALEGLGWLLDTPGAYTRGLLSGRPGERVSGREMLTDWGLTKPNDPNKWEVGDFLGFGAEVLADPLTWMTLGASATTKVGQTLAKAGAGADDLVKIAKLKAVANNVPVGQIGKIGQRQARLSTTVDDILTYGDEVVPGLSTKFKENLAARGIDPTASADQVMGGLVGIANPFTGYNRAIVGSGKTAQGIAKGLDITGAAIAKTAPYRLGAKLFHASVGDSFNRALQSSKSEMAAKKMDSYIAIDSQMQNWMHQLGGEKASQQSLDAMNWAAENVKPGASLDEINVAVKKAGFSATLGDTEYNIVGALQIAIPKARQDLLDIGVFVPEYKDPRVENYMPRRVTQDRIGGSAPEEISDFQGKDLTMNNPNLQARNKEAEIRGGKVRAVQFEKDKNVSGAGSLKTDDDERMFYVAFENPDSVNFIRDKALTQKIIKGDYQSELADVAVRSLEQQIRALGDSTTAAATAKRSQLQDQLKIAQEQFDTIVSDIKGKVEAGDKNYAHLNVSNDDAKKFAKDLYEESKTYTFEAKNKTDSIIESIAKTYGVLPAAVKDVLTPAVVAQNADVAKVKGAYATALNDVTNQFSQDPRGLKRLWEQVYANGAKSAADVTEVDLANHVPAFQQAFGTQRVQDANDVFELMKEFGKHSNLNKIDSLRAIGAAQPDLLSKIAADLSDNIAARSEEIANRFSKNENDILQELSYSKDFAKWLKSVDPARSEYGVGLRDNLLLKDAGDYLKSMETTKLTAKAIYGAMGDVASNVKLPGYEDISEVLRNANFHKGEETFLPQSVKAAQEYIQKFTGKDASYRYIPADLAGEIQKTMMRAPEQETLKLFDTVTRFQKAFMLLAPAYNVRNLMGGIVQNSLDGAYGDLKKLPMLIKASWSLSRGKDAAGLSKIPGIAKLVKDSGMELNDKNANAVFRNLVNAGQVGHSGYTHEASNILDYTSEPKVGEGVSASTTGKDYRSNPIFVNGRLAPDVAVPKKIRDNYESIYSSQGEQAAKDYLKSAGIIGDRGGLINEFGVEMGRVRRGRSTRNVNLNTLGIDIPDVSANELYGGTSQMQRAINENAMLTARPYVADKNSAAAQLFVEPFRAARDVAGATMEGGLGEGWRKFKESSLNPIKLANVGGQKDTKFFAVKANEMAAQNVEIFNRASSALGWIIQGVDPVEAVKRANRAHVDYNDLSKFEKGVMRRLMPFYGFNRGMSKYIAAQLAEHPGGALSHTIQQTNSGRADESWLPDYVGEGAAIPNFLTGEKDSYITGFGLMHEGPLNMVAFGQGIGPTYERTTQKLISNMNPFVKGSVEAATGTNLYTGRPFGESYQYPFKDATDPNVQFLNAVLTNSPAGRALSIARKLEDPRKTDLNKAFNILTGISIANVHGGRERAMEFEARKAMEAALMRSPHIKSFQTPYVPKDKIGKLTEDERKLLGLMKLYNKRAKEAAKKRREEEAKKR